jgi:hypothetical protein
MDASGYNSFISTCSHANFNIMDIDIRYFSIVVAIVSFSSHVSKC